MRCRETPYSQHTLLITTTPSCMLFPVSQLIILDQCYGKMHLEKSFSLENKSLLFLIRHRERLKLHLPSHCANDKIDRAMIGQKLCLTSQELPMVQHGSIAQRSVSNNSQLDALGKLTKRAI